MGWWTTGAAAGLALAAGGAAAQDADFEAAMEVQRCIWSCQANFPVWSDYEACVARTCDGGEPEAAGGVAAKGPVGDWRVGTGTDGRPYAAVVAPGVDGEAGLYVQCSGGRGSLAIGGFDGGNADMAVAVGGATYPVPAGPNDYPEVGITAGSPLLAALRSGSSVDVISEDGRVVVTYTLRGSSAALGRLGGDC